MSGFTFKNDPEGNHRVSMLLSGNFANDQRNLESAWNPDHCDIGSRGEGAQFFAAVSNQPFDVLGIELARDQDELSPNVNNPGRRWNELRHTPVIPAREDGPSSRAWF